MEPEPGVAFISEFSCTVCGEGGDNVCCDTCPKVFHLPCIGLESMPEGEFRCAYCMVRQESEAEKRKQEINAAATAAASSSSSSQLRPITPATSSADEYEHKSQRRPSTDDRDSDSALARDAALARRLQDQENDYIEEETSGDDSEEGEDQDDEEPNSAAPSHSMASRSKGKRKSSDTSSTRLRNRDLAAASASHDSPILISDDEDSDSMQCHRCRMAGLDLSVCSACKNAFHGECDALLDQPPSTKDEIRLCVSCVQKRLKAPGQSSAESTALAIPSSARASSASPLPHVANSSAAAAATSSKPRTSPNRKDVPPNPSSRPVRKRGRPKEDIPLSTIFTPPPPPPIYPKQSLILSGSGFTQEVAASASVRTSSSIEAHAAQEKKSIEPPRLRANNIASLALYLRHIHWKFVHEKPAAVDGTMPMELDDSMNSSHAAAASSSSSTVAASASVAAAASSSSSSSSLAYLNRNFCSCHEIFGPLRKYPQNILTATEMQLCKDDMQRMRDQLWNVVYTLQSKWQHLDVQWHEDLKAWYSQYYPQQARIVRLQSELGLTALTPVQLDAKCDEKASADKRYMRLRVLRTELKEMEKMFKKTEENFSAAFLPPYEHFTTLDRQYQTLTDVYQYLTDPIAGCGLRSARWHRMLESYWDDVRALETKQTQLEQTESDETALRAYRDAPLATPVALDALSPPYTPSYGCYRCDARYPLLLEVEQHIKVAHRRNGMEDIIVLGTPVSTPPVAVPPVAPAAVTPSPPPPIYEESKENFVTASTAMDITPIASPPSIPPSITAPVVVPPAASSSSSSNDPIARQACLDLIGQWKPTATSSVLKCLEQLLSVDGVQEQLLTALPQLIQEQRAKDAKRAKSKPSSASTEKSKSKFSDDSAQPTKKAKLTNNVDATLALPPMNSPLDALPPMNPPSTSTLPPMNPPSTTTSLPPINPPGTLTPVSTDERNLLYMHQLWSYQQMDAMQMLAKQQKERGQQSADIPSSSLKPATAQSSTLPSRLVTNGATNDKSSATHSSSSSADDSNMTPFQQALKSIAESEATTPLQSLATIEHERKLALAQW